MNTRGPAFALLAATLFGASTPLAKLLVAGMSPWLLAGLLYLGSGVGLGLFRMLRRSATSVLGPALAAAPSAERTVQGAERFWLLAAVGAGGVAGPVLLMFGLTVTPAASASLLLNLEGVLTALLAWFVFREAFDRRLVLGMLSIVAGAVLLSWGGVGGSEGAGGWWGPVAIALACLMWGLDNNLTRKVSLADPVDVAMIKGLVAGVTNVTIALLAGADLPSAGHAAAAMAVGLAGYGVSLVLFVLALRHVGAARTGAYFSTAPFVGALLALAVFDEAPTLPFAAAAVLMGIGVWLHLTEDHEHEHLHDEMVHDHPHRHDEHHRHSHDDAVTEPHSHPHRHTRLRHRHPHYPDAHHTHAH